MLCIVLKLKPDASKQLIKSPNSLSHATQIPKGLEAHFRGIFTAVNVLCKGHGFN